MMFPTNRILRSAFLFGVSSLVLTGCGGSGGGSASTAAALGGLAMDGYLQNATVCLDINLNGTCDANEPTTTTDANGAYSLTPPSTAVAKTAPVLVVAKAGVTVDSDTGTAVPNTYVLYAPPGYKVVNPITSLLTQQAIASGALTVGSAGDISGIETSVAQSVLGSPDTSLLDADYIADQKSTTLTAQQKQELADAHATARHIAQVVGVALSSTPVTVSQNTEDGILSLAAYRRVLANMSSVKALASNATAAEVDAALHSLEDGITSSEAASEEPLSTRPQSMTLASLTLQSDWPTDYHALQAKTSTQGTTVVRLLDDDYTDAAVSSASGGSYTLGATAQRLTADASGKPLQWTADTSASHLYVWNPLSSLMELNGPVGALAVASDSAGSSTVAGIPVTLTLNRVSLSGENIASALSRFDLGFPESGVNTSNLFSTGAAAYIYRVKLLQPLLTALAPASATALSPLTSSLATGYNLPSGVTGTLYSLTVSNTEQKTQWGWLILGSNGSLYGVTADSSGQPVTTAVTTLGTYTSSAASTSLPALDRLNFSCQCQLDALQPLAEDIDHGAAQVLFTTAGNTYGGILHAASQQLMDRVLLNDTARTDAVNDITLPLTN